MPQFPVHTYFVRVSALSIEIMDAEPLVQLVEEFKRHGPSCKVSEPIVEKRFAADPEAQDGQSAKL